LDNKVFDITDARCSHEDIIQLFNVSFSWKAGGFAAF